VLHQLPIRNQEELDKQIFPNVLHIRGGSFPAYNSTDVLLRLAFALARATRLLVFVRIWPEEPANAAEGARSQFGQRCICDVEQPKHPMKMMLHRVFV
jgi:hypothetical protein